MNKTAIKIALAFCILIVSQCKLIRYKDNAINIQISDASAYPYASAMGKGLGVVFGITLKNNKSKPFTIDSLSVNGIYLPFTTKNQDSLILLEAVHYKNMPEPTVDSDGNMHTDDLNDPILMQQIYNPAYLVVKQKGQHKKVKIEKIIIKNSDQK
ncbi:MAG: hypothetical protein Q8M15_00905 [Bacteroidota bacterium]|nr:hypothetical protein [Bacteroidota bacterium]